MAITRNEVATAIDGIADQWRAERSERQQRRRLDRSDFDLLRDAGILLVGAPEDQGVIWRSVEESTRSTLLAVPGAGRHRWFGHVAGDR